MILICVSLIVIISGCVNQIEKENKNRNAYSCSTDSDCVVKDVHNCCGYYPRCVNKDYIPDVEAVKRECQEKGMASICGWPEITHCKCVDNSCKSMQGDSTV